VSDAATALAALLTSVGLLITAVVGGWVLYRKVRAEAKADAARVLEASDKAHGELVVIKGEVRSLGEKVDGRLTQLIKSMDATSAAEVKVARAEGVALGEQSQRDRDSYPIHPETKP
jgi:hypothetical protein